MPTGDQCGVMVRRIHSFVFKSKGRCFVFMGISQGASELIVCLEDRSMRGSTRRQANSATWPLLVCSWFDTWNCTLLSAVWDPKLYAPWDPGGHNPRLFEDGGLRASRMLRRGECHGPCGPRYRIAWADARRGLQAQGMRELGDQQLHLKGESTTERGIEEPEPETEDPGKGGWLLLPP